LRSCDRNRRAGRFSAAYLIAFVTGSGVGGSTPENRDIITATSSSTKPIVEKKRHKVDAGTNQCQIGIVRNLKAVAFTPCPRRDGKTWALKIETFTTLSRNHESGWRGCKQSQEPPGRKPG
jgi:hypothetical protein